MADYPTDMAKAVLDALTRKCQECPTLPVLDLIFENMFFASLKTEEGDPITLHVVYLNPANSDPDRPTNVSHDRWTFVNFTEPIIYNVPNLVKLAKATDPRTSSLAIYPDIKGNILIWGLIDQGNRYYDFVNYESESGPDRPGIFGSFVFKLKASDSAVRSAGGF